jgi:hypothetical protein
MFVDRMRRLPAELVVHMFTHYVATPVLAPELRADLIHFVDTYKQIRSNYVEYHARIWNEPAEEALAWMCNDVEHFLVLHAPYASPSLAAISKLRGDQVQSIRVWARLTRAERDAFLIFVLPDLCL